MRWGCGVGQLVRRPLGGLSTASLLANKHCALHVCVRWHMQQGSACTVVLSQARGAGVGCEEVVGLAGVPATLLSSKA